MTFQREKKVFINVLQWKAVPKTSPKRSDALPLSGGLIDFSDENNYLISVAVNPDNLNTVFQPQSSEFENDNFVKILLEFVASRNQGRCPTFTSKWKVLREGFYKGHLAEIRNSFELSNQQNQPSSLASLLSTFNGESHQENGEVQLLNSKEQIEKRQKSESKVNIKTKDSVDNVISSTTTRIILKKELVCGIRRQENFVYIKFYPILKETDSLAEQRGNEVVIQTKDGFSTKALISESAKHEWNIHEKFHSKESKVMTMIFKMVQ